MTQQNTVRPVSHWEETFDIVLRKHLTTGMSGVPLHHVELSTNLTMNPRTQAELTAFIGAQAHLKPEQAAQEFRYRAEFAIQNAARKAKRAHYIKILSMPVVLSALIALIGVGVPPLFILAAVLCGALAALILTARRRAAGKVWDNRSYETETTSDVMEKMDAVLDRTPLACVSKPLAIALAAGIVACVVLQLTVVR